MSQSAAFHWGRDGVALFVLVGIVVAMRLPAWSIPLETDEANYAVIGERLMAGDRLYVDVWDHQPPGVFVLFGVVGGLLGDNDAAYRAAATLASMVTCVLVYLVLIRRGTFAGALCGAGLFAVTAADPGTAGDGCNREVFMNALVMGSFALLTYRDRPPSRNLLWAGFLLGIASTLKTVIAAPWLALSGAMIWHSWRDTRSLRQAAKTLALMSAGPAVIWLALGGYFRGTSRGSLFVDAVFQFNTGYASLQEGFLKRFVAFFGNDRFGEIVTSGWPVWIAGGVAFVAIGVSGIIALGKSSNAARSMVGTSLIIALLIGCYVAVCLPAQFWSHYYRLMWPGLVLSVGFAVGCLRWSAFQWLAGVLVVAMAFGWQYENYLVKPWHAVGDETFAYRRVWAKAIGERVASVTRSGDSVFVWGNDAGIYHYADRRCASRFTIITGLREGLPGHVGRREQLLADLSQREPRVVLIAEPEFDALKQYLQTRYLLAGMDLRDEDRGDPILVVLTRADDPIDAVDWDWRAPWMEESTP